MLTISSKGRVFDYSHVIGGRAFRGITYITKVNNDSLFAVYRDAYNSGILCVEGVDSANAEEMSTKFAPINMDPTQSWPTCITASDSHVFVTDELQNQINVFDFSGNFVEEIKIHGEKTYLNKPSGIVIDDSNHIFISNTGNHEILKLNLNGALDLKWGSEGNKEKELDSPWGICLTYDECVLVSDHLNNRVHKFTMNGVHLLTFGESGLPNERLNHPADVSIDQDGDIYVADWVNNRVQVYDQSGSYILSLYGSANGLSKWQKQYVNGNPDVYKARRRVASLEQEIFFTLPTCVEYDDVNDRLLWLAIIPDFIENLDPPTLGINHK